MVLPQTKPVGMPGGKIADVEARSREAGHLRHLTLGEEAAGNAPLVQDLKGSCVQAARTCTREFLVGTPLHDGSINSRQRQFAGQHQPGRASADYYRCMITHCSGSVLQVAGTAIVRPRPGLAASPAPGDILEMEGAIRSILVPPNYCPWHGPGRPVWV
nr:hypothetical protein GCM10017547_15100 [Pseudarthrobacter oxydans]